MAFEVCRRKPENGTKYSRIRDSRISEKVRLFEYGVNMALKCAICNEKVEANFLEKIFGTYIGSGKSKKAVCNSCQKKYGDKITEMVK
ncbi:MAG: hypothetical protein V1734_03585 [Nanoarchaeota archaeon]